MSSMIFHSKNPNDKTTGLRLMLLLIFTSKGMRYALILKGTLISENIFICLIFIVDNTR